MVVTTKAIVLSSLKYSESDLIVSCFTETFGLKSYLLRGILKSRKGKLRVSHFQPLTQLDLVAVHKNKGTLERISEAKVLQPYQSLHTDVVKGAIVMFLSEMLKNSINEEHPDPELFKFLEQSLYWLDTHDKVSNFHLLFLLKLTAYLGFYPDVSTIEGEYFNVIEGNFQNTKDAVSYENTGVIAIFKQFFGIDFDELDALKLTKKTRSDVLNLLLMYYKFHLQGYRDPKSVLVLNQLFN
ncbi:DNA repair protein RecO [Constantimarinum furrinae]|uniref:DNA repair protein RecO n=1 Tax=Constantimarinum furrinae TaxID=2562285 RepID=A0A7G8PTG6_9FLAO|nr:DNA repair protein RecO [Constantimarinum furrinae]QNJ97632.1 DNA repair protein RecO [Constantimarinum furrinae]